MSPLEQIITIDGDRVDEIGDIPPSFERRRQLMRLVPEETIEIHQFTDPRLIHSKMSLATRALRDRLIARGMPNNWIPNRATIYEKAIVALADHIKKTAMPEYVRREGFDELGLSAEALFLLFTNQIPLKFNEKRYDETIGLDILEGYFNYPEDTLNRLIIEHRANSVFSRRLGRDLTPSCQIKIKNIRGLSLHGKAIADSDSEIRLGLRYYMIDTKNHWTVSIESGVHDLVDRKWKIIRPLSQAIGACNFDGLNHFTYHYNDRDFIFTSNQANISWFCFFNNALMSIFQESIRLQYYQKKHARFQS